MLCFLFPLVLPCLLVSLENPTKLFNTLGRCTQQSSSHVYTPTQTEATETHPASVVGRNLEKFGGAGEGGGDALEMVLFLRT